MSAVDTDMIDGDIGELEVEPAESTKTLAARRAFRIARIVALVAVVAAIAVNWWWASRLSGSALPSNGGVTAGSVDEKGDAVALEKPSVDMLPKSILQYETITRQSVPGLGDAGAEAIYKTLNMNTEAQISVVVYARTEGFATDEQAEAKAREWMNPYTVDRASTSLGSTPMISGYTTDHSSYSYGWVRGRYATLVKASFAEWTPEHTFEIAKRQADMVAKAVEIFQRTGKQGVKAE